MRLSLADTLRAMADDCQSGQRTGKSDRWALTLRDAAKSLDELDIWMRQAATAQDERDAALALLEQIVHGTVPLNTFGGSISVVISRVTWDTIEILLREHKEKKP